MYFDACSTHVTLVLLFQIFMEILFHIFPFLFDQTLGSYKFIDCSCLGAQVCSHAHLLSWQNSPIFKSLTSSVSGCSISLLSVPSSLWCHLPSNVPLDWTHYNVTSEWLSLAHLAVWTWYLLEYPGLYVMGASCGSISPFDAASSALPVFDVLHLKGKKQLVK